MNQRQVSMFQGFRRFEAQFVRYSFARDHFETLKLLNLETLKP